MPSTPGVEVELIVSVIETCLLLPTILCVFRFPLRSDSFSKFSLWLLLLPESIQLIMRIGLSITENLRPSTAAMAMMLRQGASVCSALSTLLLVVCSYHHLHSLDYKGSAIYKLLTLGVFGSNACLLAVAVIMGISSPSNSKLIGWASIFAFGENLVLWCGVISILASLYLQRGGFAERRRGPEAKVLFRQTMAYSEWQFAVYFFTFEYYLFDPAYTCAEYSSWADFKNATNSQSNPSIPWSPYPYGTFWAFFRLLRPTLSLVGIWLWHAAFRYDLRRVLRQKGHKATNTITISGDFSGRNEPAPVGTSRGESISNNRLSATSLQHTRRLNIPQLVKGPFAHIERQQQRLGTSYMNRR